MSIMEVEQGKWCASLVGQMHANTFKISALTAHMNVDRLKTETHILNKNYKNNSYLSIKLLNVMSIQRKSDSFALPIHILLLLSVMEEYRESRVAGWKGKAHILQIVTHTRVVPKVMSNNFL